MPNPQPIASCRGRFPKRPFLATALFSTLRRASLPTLSSRAKRGICFFTVFATLFCAHVNAQGPRPKITRLDHVRLYVSDVEKARDFYSHLYGVRPDYNPCYEGLRPCFTIGWGREQRVVLAQAPFEQTNYVAEIVFRTDNVERLRRYLKSKGIAPTKITKDKFLKSVLDHFEISDPEGHAISFVQLN